MNRQPGVFVHPNLYPDPDNAETPSLCERSQANRQAMRVVAACGLTHRLLAFSKAARMIPLSATVLSMIKNEQRNGA